jgi:hypothetical protein
LKKLKWAAPEDDGPPAVGRHGAADADPAAPEGDGADCGGIVPETEENI